MAERDLARESDRLVAMSQREKDQAEKALKAEIEKELLEVVMTPGLRKDEPVPQETEEAYTKRLRGSLRAEFLKHASTR